MLSFKAMGAGYASPNRAAKGDGMIKWTLLAAAGALSACMTLQTSACDLGDPVLAGSAFVIATAPAPGTRVQSGFKVGGCSRTFEGSVIWRLLGRDGGVLARGFTTGGAVDGPGAFTFTVEYTVSEPEVGHLEVTEEDVSDGEGFPPGRTVLPLILMP